MAEKKRIELAVIAGASQALKYKERNPRATDQEILQHVTKEVKNVINKIDEIF